MSWIIFHWILKPLDLASPIFFVVLNILRFVSYFISYFILYEILCYFSSYFILFCFSFIFFLIIHFIYFIYFLLFLVIFLALRKDFELDNRFKDLSLKLEFVKDNTR